MTNLQDRIRGLTDPPASGGEVDLTMPTGSMTLTARVPVLVTESEPVYIRPDPFILTFDALLLAAPEAPSVVGAFNFLKAPPSLGRIFAEVIGPGGDIHHPTLEGLVAEETAPGGFGPASGRISERVFKAHPDVYRQDAKLVLYLESDGTCLHGGRIVQPDVAGGAVTIASKGHAARAEKQMEPVLYSSEDASKWTMQQEFGDEAASDTVNPWRFDVRQHALDSEISHLSFAGPAAQGSAKAVAWWPGQDLARLTFKAQVGAIEAGNGAYIEVRSYSVGWSYFAETDGEVPELGVGVLNWYGTLGPTGGETIIHVDIDLTLQYGALGDPNVNGDNRADPSVAFPGIVYPDLITIEVTNDEAIVSPNENIQVDLIDVRTYGAATGTAFGRRRFSTSELVLDLCGRMGIRVFDLEASGFNILPYEIEDGMPYADGFDFADLLSGNRTLFRDTGHKAFVEHGPWNTRTWEIASPWAQLDVVGAPRYNRVRVPFTYKDGQTVGSKLAKADPDLLDHRSYFGRVGLASPARNNEAAEALGAQLATQLSTVRHSAQFSIGEVIGPSGPTSGHHVFAGDTLDGSPRGAPNGLRVTTLRRGYDFVEGTCGSDFSAGSQVTGVPALDRMLARREKRTAA